MYNISIHIIYIEEYKIIKMFYDKKCKFILVIKYIGQSNKIIKNLPNNLEYKQIRKMCLYIFLLPI